MHLLFSTHIMALFWPTILFDYCVLLRAQFWASQPCIPSGVKVHFIINIDSVLVENSLCGCNEWCLLWNICLEMVQFGRNDNVLDSSGQQTDTTWVFWKIKVAMDHGIMKPKRYFVLHTQTFSRWELVSPSSVWHIDISCSIQGVKQPMVHSTGTKYRNFDLDTDITCMKEWLAY